MSTQQMRASQKSLVALGLRLAAWYCVDVHLRLVNSRASRSTDAECGQRVRERTLASVVVSMA